MVESKFTAEPHLAPNSEVKPDSTIGFWTKKIDPRLVEASASADAIPLLEQLVWLTQIKNDEPFLNAICGFLGGREIGSILTAWAKDDDSCASLESLSYAIWSKPGLADDLRPFGDDQRISKALRGNLASQYVASLCGARDAVIPGDPESVTFIRKLRLLFLSRSLDALKSEDAIHEASLSEASTELRKACDAPQDTRLQVLIAISSKETAFEDFCQDVRLRSERELGHSKWSASEKQLLRAIKTICSGGPWKPKLTREDLSLAGKVVLPPLSKAAPRTIAWVDIENTIAQGDSIFIGDDTGNEMGLVAVDADSTKPPARNSRRGQGLILASVEQSQFLRHSWDRISQPEAALLHTHILQLLASKALSDKVGGAMLILSQVACRSFYYLEQTAISTDIQTDWTLEPKSAMFWRRPPRFGRGVKTDANMREWIQPLASQWTVTLAKPAQSALKSALSMNPEAKKLGDLWAGLSPNANLETWFRNLTAGIKGLSRVNSNINASVFLQEAFASTSHQGFTKLLGSQPRTGLPATCAYAAFRTEAIQSAIQPTKITHPSLFKLKVEEAEKDTNACGSELDILLHRVRNSIGELVNKLNLVASENSDVIRYHNLLTSLTVLALYASTGARPINSPFESLNWINLDEGLIFVEDKVTGPTRSARLCVISRTAKSLIQDRYLVHLQKLRGALIGVAPQLCSGIDRILAGDPEAKLPLFFYIRCGKDIDWTEVTETSLRIESNVDWPLPGNLFRHIHATYLIRIGLESEIVDALLGHAERGAETHGDYSLRIPADDLKTARPLVNNLFGELGFTLTLPLKDYPTAYDCEESSDALPRARSFGRHARQLARKESQTTAYEKAKAEIQACIEANNGKLAPEQLWHEIAKKMLFRPNGMPHPSASLRYEVYEEFVSEMWRHSRVLTQVRRTYSVLPPPQTIFNDEVFSAAECLKNIRSRFEDVALSVSEQGLGPTVAAMFAAIDLICVSRLTFSKPLRALICMTRSVRLVKFQDSFWFEWCDTETWRDGLPMLRIKISARCARWIGIALSSAKVSRTLPAVPKALQDLVKSISDDISINQFINTLCVLQNQRNAFDMPGTDAAFLAGRQRFPALPHRDWYRFTCSRALAANALDEPQSTQDDEVVLMGHHHKATSASNESSKVQTCAEFFSYIKEILADDTASSDKCRSAIEDRLKTVAFHRNSFPYAFAFYVVHLLQRKPKHGKRDGLRTNTAARYVASLADPICEMAHDVNMLELDEEELTELYTSLIEWWFDRFSKYYYESSEDRLGQQRLSQEQRSQDAARRALVQLKEFHEYTARWMSLDEPDWSQIATGEVGAIGRAGYITPAEYRHSLHTLIGNRSIQQLPDIDLLACGTLLLCYRFGTRVSEAIGLTTSDWVDVKGSIVLLVRPNQLRSLKTSYSKRQVPLVGKLDEIESEVIEQMLYRGRHLHYQGEDGPLFTSVTAHNFKAVKAKTSSTLLRTLKLVTRNPDCVIHAARHSFASNLFAVVRGSADSKPALFPGIGREDVLRLLIGRMNVDRRTMWAICRMLGHKSPSVTQACYVHGIDQWLPSMDDNSTWDGSGVSGGVVFDLDSQLIDHAYLAPIELGSSTKLPEESLFLRYLRCLRLIGMGQQPLDAGMHSHLNERELSSLLLAVNSINGKLVTRPTDAPASAIENLLRSVSPRRIGVLSDMGKRALGKSQTPNDFALAETMGLRAQIVLFLPIHFICFGEMLRAIGLTKSDIGLVSSKNLDPQVLAWMQSAGLEGFQVAPAVFGESFQLDTATHGPQEMGVKHRTSAMPLPGAKTVTSRPELRLLWLCWVAANRSQNIFASPNCSP